MGAFLDKNYASKMILEISFRFSQLLFMPNERKVQQIALYI
jgi:hypothetical protein